MLKMIFQIKHFYSNSKTAMQANTLGLVIY